MSYFADLHIHVGINEEGKWVKIPSTKRLTVRNILQTASEQKGLDIIGLVDALSPLVQKDLARLIAEKELVPLSGGGYRYQGKLTLLLGAEIETREAEGGLAHSLLFLPTLEQFSALTREMAKYIANVNISSQNAHMNLENLYKISRKFDAKFIPAHIFTPFKSIYGNCSDRIAKLFALELPAFSAVELGLSADAILAGQIKELENYSFLASSDAHSLQNIAREFSELEIEGQVDFASVFAAIEGKYGRVKALYGLNPRLGKYYSTRCAACSEYVAYGLKKCPLCQGRVISGVKDRIEEISDQKEPKLATVEYKYHTPLLEIPGIGKKTLEKIYCSNLTELFIMYLIDKETLANLLGAKVAEAIDKVRKQKFFIKSGGAGRYGHVIINQ